MPTPQNKFLVVSCHPLENSMCRHITSHILLSLKAAGHTVKHIDLYSSGFSPLLTARERETYYDGPYDGNAVSGEIHDLQTTDSLILVFPTWWFGFPAALKGWFDRVWAPGIAYDHADNFGPIRHRLGQLKNVLAVTTLGSPWYVDMLLLRRPIRRVLKTAIVGTCAPKAKFRMLSLYNSEKLALERIERFLKRIDSALAEMKI